MSVNRKTLMILAGLAVLMSLTACTREITTVQEVDAGASNCFTCHTDQDPFLAEAQMEWANSAHGIGAYVGYAGNRNGCSECHSGAGFVASLAGEEEVPYGTSIGCFACHSPHSNGDFGLRITDAVALENGYSQDLGTSNLCVSCHKSRQSVYELVSAVDGVVTITSSHWGPHHSPQTDVLVGSNGFEFDGYTYDTAAPTAHVSGACLACHMNSNTVDLGGHSFNMANEGGDLNVASCNACHTDVEDYDIGGVQTAIDLLAEELHTLLFNAGLVTEDGHPIADTTPTLAQAGALYNYILWEEDQSHGVHNPAYITDLLESSIDQFAPVQ